MPPSTWMHSCTQDTAASTASDGRGRGREVPLPCRPALGQRRESVALAASQTAAAACSAATSIRAHRCLTAWNWPIGRPNWWRILAYSAAVCTAQSGDAERLGAEHDGGEARDRARVAARSAAGRRGTATSSGRHPAERAGQVEAVDGSDVQARRRPPPPRPCPLSRADRTGRITRSASGSAEYGRQRCR